MIRGIPEKATKYIQNNSPFHKGAFIGCKNSDGLINISATMYKKEIVKDKIVFLFAYNLKDGYSCREVFQKEIDGNIFICLQKSDGKFIKWTKKEMIGVVTNGGMEL